MTRKEARQIIAIWLVSSKGAKGQRGYIEGWFDEEDVEAFRMAIEALQQESKRGKWLNYLKEGLKWKCSECGSKYTTPWHYCPNCGARMESDGE